MHGWTEDPTGESSHRPWPLPREPWIMAQRWSDLLFAHWPVTVEILRQAVPEVLPLETFEGSAWISIASFYLSHLRPHWLPAPPVLAEFPELNLRTYVSLGGKPGVYFFSLDAGSALAVAAARALYHLPYFRADMRVRRDTGGVVSYVSRRTDRRGRPAEFRARYRPVGPVQRSAPGSIDHWLSERYCLYAVDGASRVYRADIHHRPWPLQPVEAEVEVNTISNAAGIGLAEGAARLAFSANLDVVVWRPRLVD
jgi:uncharacterized protein